jgi:hypothetical protein
MTIDVVIFITLVLVIIYSQVTSSIAEKKRLSKYKVAINKANDFYRFRNYKLALEAYREAKNLRPSNYGSSEPEYQIVKCYFHIGNYNEVLAYSQFENEEDELFYKSKSAIEIGDMRLAKRFIDKGIKLNHSRFRKLKDEIINPVIDFEYFWTSIEINSRRRLLENIQHNSSVNKITAIDFELLFNLEHLDLSCRTESKIYNQIFVKESSYRLKDVSFLKFFNKIKYLNLCGQKDISDLPEIEFLHLLEEINFAYTGISELEGLHLCSNLKFLNFYSTNVSEKTIKSIRISIPNCEINCTISNKYEINSNLQSLVKPLWINKHTNYFGDLRKYFDSLNKNNLQAHYPKFLIPMDFMLYPSKFKEAKILEPLYDRKSIQTIGASEKFFYNYLKKQTSEAIFDNAVLEKHKGYLPKFPDLLLADYENKVFIDIEIDEPYSFTTKQATHFIGTDDDRNFEFLYNNWFVIRFTEEQVIRYPEKCCEFIINIKNKIVAKMSEPQAEFDVEFQFRQTPWTKEEAFKLMAEKYREEYLDKLI